MLYRFSSVKRTFGKGRKNSDLLCQKSHVPPCRKRVDCYLVPIEAIQKLQSITTISRHFHIQDARDQSIKLWTKSFERHFLQNILFPNMALDRSLFSCQYLYPFFMSNLNSRMKINLRRRTQNLCSNKVWIFGFHQLCLIETNQMLSKISEGEKNSSHQFLYFSMKADSFYCQI